jgi:CPA2 family monovalent cation:H+ antiporter-2
VALRELFDASLEDSAEALKALGMHPFKVEKMSRAFRRHDLAGLEDLYELWDADTAMSRNKAYLARAREHAETLTDLMATDRLQLHDRSERGWTPPPKGYIDDLDD